MVRLESRPPNIEGKGEITIRDLVINSLRMRPERIVVGLIAIDEEAAWAGSNRQMPSALRVLP